MTHVKLARSAIPVAVTVVTLTALACAKAGSDAAPMNDSSISAAAPADSAFREVQRRGQMAMGVNQDSSVHEFDITDNGGRIQLQKKTFDSVEVAQIRAHLRLIQHAFSSGDFTTPEFVHSREMPGVAVMERKKTAIKYTYGDTPLGAEIRITTADAEARSAIAQFLSAQRGDHKAHGAGVMKHEE